MKNNKLPENSFKVLSILIFALFFIVVSCSGPFVEEYPKAFRVKIRNNADFARNDEIISLKIADIKTKYADFNPEAVIVLSDDKEIPSQVNDEDGNPAQFLFITNLNSAEEQTITVRYNPDLKLKRSYEKRTQAELSHKSGGQFVNQKYIGGEFINTSELYVPAEHTDHSSFIRYEGPGWESDKVGYRFYMDWRNATDIFGKKTTDMVLQNIGQDGFDSYHEMNSWGMDILKVGESLGLGSIGMSYNNKTQRVAETDSIYSQVSSNGPIESSIKTIYYGWQVGDYKSDLTSKLSITAGSRATLCELSFSVQPENMCTGIVKHDSIEIITSDEKDGWQYFATYGKQSLANDSLGMAIFYNPDNLIRLTEDEHSYLIELKPEKKQLKYYFLAAWEKELNAITSKAKFINHLKNTAARLNSNIDVAFQ